ncbi:hypothetical protein H0W26_04790, partial [Candidatus Dependentiae bacterium]|nr:hypothetical protein [Candidatus Dependentiae bacterium]
VKEKEGFLAWETFAEICITPESGLLFLHALTLLQMSPKNHDQASNNYFSDNYFLQQTKEMYEKFSQIDAKAWLLLMSRKPFSSMFEEVLDNQAPESSVYSYKDLFYHAIQSNPSFNEESKFFIKTNYGEELFDAQGNPENLTHFLNYFTNDFKKEGPYNIPEKANEILLSFLFVKGIITTAMIRNLTIAIPDFIDDLFDSTHENNFFKKSISSIDFPTARHMLRLAKDTKALVIELEEAELYYDILSPPMLLDKENGMGRIKEKEMEKQDSKFGEAIIEIRLLRSISNWFLTYMELSPEIEVGDFLVFPEQNFKGQAMGLFTFLKKFSTSLPSIQEIVLELVKEGI